MKFLTENNKVFTVVRKTLPSLRATAMKDFIEVWRGAGKFREELYNRTDHSFFFGTNEIEFISADSPQKLRGRKRNYLWLNEANELNYEDYQQLMFRTTEQVFLDYNPSDQFHWIYEKVLTRPDCTFIKSTYLDNPFLDKTTIDEIERLKGLDANYWRVYGLGERGVSETIIYKHWNYIDELPELYDDEYYGLDFGFNNKTALTQIRENDQEINAKELIYESNLTNSDLIQRLIDLEVSRTAIIWCDSAEPQRIEELRRADFNAMPANKDVLKGIDTLKSSKLHITKDSVNLAKELQSYSWKEKNGIALDEPVKANDHAVDSLRYGVHSNKNQAFIGFV